MHYCLSLCSVFLRSCFINLRYMEHFIEYNCRKKVSWTGTPRNPKSQVPLFSSISHSSDHTPTQATYHQMLGTRHTKTNTRALLPAHTLSCRPEWAFGFRTSATCMEGREMQTENKSAFKLVPVKEWLAHRFDYEEDLGLSQSFTQEVVHTKVLL